LGEGGGDFVVIEDGLGGDVFGVGVEHDAEERGVGLGFDGDGIAGAEESFEEIEDAQAVLGENKKLGGGGFVFPGAGDGDGAVAGGFAVGGEEPGLGPAGAGVEGVEHDLAVQLGAVEVAQGSDLLQCGWAGGEVHDVW
jgi:hypothetical protein